jgi:hypothetical protein
MDLNDHVVPQTTEEEEDQVVPSVGRDYEDEDEDEDTEEEDDEDEDEDDDEDTDDEQEETRALNALIQCLADAGRITRMTNISMDEPPAKKKNA